MHRLSDRSYVVFYIFVEPDHSKLSRFASPRPKICPSLLPSIPGIYRFALLAISFGIGAASAVFSLTDRILFRALPYSADQQLVSLGMLAKVVDDGEFLFAADYKDLLEMPILLFGKLPPGAAWMIATSLIAIRLVSAALTWRLLACMALSLT
jgi:hypothetical protein